MKKFPLKVLGENFPVDLENHCKDHIFDGGNTVLFNNMGQACPNFAGMQQKIVANKGKKGLEQTELVLRCHLKELIESMRLKGQPIKNLQELKQVVEETSLYRTRIAPILKNADPACPLAQRVKGEILEILEQAQSLAS